MDVDVSTRAELAVGILHVDGRRLDRALGPSTVWQSGHLPPDLRADAAHGEDLARWAPIGFLAPQEAARLADTWSAALPPLGRGISGYLRVRVDTPPMFGACAQSARSTAWR